MKKAPLFKALCFLVGAPWCAAEVPLEDAAFASLHAMLRPQPEESPWMEIDWYPSVWEGRQRAAEEGKPLFLMAGSGGAPCAGC